MTKDLERLSAWYDDEISQEDFDKGLESLGSSSESKKYYTNTLFYLS